MIVKNYFEQFELFPQTQKLKIIWQLYKPILNGLHKINKNSSVTDLLEIAIHQTLKMDTR